MPDYDYTKTAQLCIDKFREEIENSAMTDKSFVCVKDAVRTATRGGGLTSIDFKVEFTGILSGADKTLLDGIVDNCVGYCCETCTPFSILSYILENATAGAQTTRIVNFLDGYGGSFLAYIKVGDYAAARLRIDAALTATDIEQADVDLMYLAVPASKYRTV